MKLLSSLQLFFLALFSSICFSDVEFKMGFGSCNDQRLSTPAWSSLEEESLNTFFFLGDNVYGDVPSGELKNLKNSYDAFDKILCLFLI